MNAKTAKFLRRVARRDRASYDLLKKKWLAMSQRERGLYRKEQE